MLAHFVLDQNFPLQATGLPWPPSIRLSRLAEIAPVLTQGHEDWQVLMALEEAGGIDGFVTNDAGMLALPREMVALSRTKLTLIVAEGVGGEALRATGLVMVHLQGIAKRLSGKPALYVLRPGTPNPRAPYEALKRIAQHQKLPLDVLVQRELSALGLERRPRSGPQ